MLEITTDSPLLERIINGEEVGKMKRAIFLLVVMSGVLLTSPTHATLWDRGGGLIYDDYLNITWLQDANYAKTSGYDADGRMNWTNATTWGANLVYGGYSDWRLPTAVDGPYVFGVNGTTNAGWNITSSEMGYMFYTNLANLGYYDTSGNVQTGVGFIPNATFTDGNGNTVSFQNLQSDDIYWADKGYSSGIANYSICKIFFLFGWPSGYQNQAYMVDNHYAWAVRDGDVAPVPEPSTLLLLGSGLAGLIGFGRRRMKK